MSNAPKQSPEHEPDVSITAADLEQQMVDLKSLQDRLDVVKARLDRNVGEDGQEPHE